MYSALQRIAFFLKAAVARLASPQKANEPLSQAKDENFIWFPLAYCMFACDPIEWRQMDVANLQCIWFFS